MKNRKDQQGFQDRKGVSLIIAIFAMMLLAILGWSLAVLQSADFEASLRQAESERALYLAEAGAQWAMQKLAAEFNCDLDGDGKDVDYGTMLHNLDFGQYRVNCTCSDASCGGEITLESTGYIPQESSGVRSMRSVELTISQGAFTNSGTIGNLFEWWAIHSGSEIEGDLSAAHFNGDNDATYDEECEDYGTTENCGQQLPPGAGVRELSGAAMPVIDMDYYKAKAVGWNRYRDYHDTGTVAGSSSGEDLRIWGGSDLSFDSSMVGEAVRIVGEDWSEQNWVVITKHHNNNWVEVELKPGIIEDMGVWADETIRVVKRFSGNNNNEKVWYIEGSDILIDLRNDNANILHTSLVAEGDIMLAGAKALKMLSYVDTAPPKETFPNLATKNGNILSEEVPEGSTESKKSNNRSFDGLIFTETGDIRFNYINGVAMMGYNIFLDGLIKLEYKPKYIDSDGFLGSISVINWEER